MPKSQVLKNIFNEFDYFIYEIQWDAILNENNNFCFKGTPGHLKTDGCDRRFDKLKKKKNQCPRQPHASTRAHTHTSQYTPRALNSLALP